MKRVTVAVRSSDPLTFAGLRGYLRSRPELLVAGEPPPAAVDVAIFATDRPRPDMLSQMRRSAAEFGIPTVLVADDLTESTLLTMVHYKVVAIVPREHATGERMLAAVLSAAAGNGSMPPAMLGRLLNGVRTLQRDVLAPLGLNPSGLEPREVDILRMLAGGSDTAQIAAELQCSERTVKNLLYALTTRLNLRNRTHAVAYAMRAGVF